MLPILSPRIPENGSRCVPLNFAVRVPCGTFALTLNTPMPLLQHKNRHMLSLLDTSPVSNEAEQIAQGPSGEVALGYFILRPTPEKYIGTQPECCDVALR